MSRFFTRPENAISKAEEFMKVGKCRKKKARSFVNLYTYRNTLVETLKDISNYF